MFLLVFVIKVRIISSKNVYVNEIVAVAKQHLKLFNNFLIVV